MHYLDTSVLTAYYCAEECSSDIQRLLSGIVGPTVSPLVEVELHCAVARKVRAGAMDEPTARRVFAEFQTHLVGAKYRVVPVQATDYGVARDWISDLTTPLRVLDALHLAVVSANGLVLVTADQALAQSAGHFGVKHKLIS